MSILIGWFFRIWEGKINGLPSQSQFSGSFIWLSKNFYYTPTSMSIYPTGCDIRGSMYDKLVAKWHDLGVWCQNPHFNSH